MKTSTLVWTVIVLAVLIGGWYWWSGIQTAGAPAAQTETQTNTPAATGTTPASVLIIGTDATGGKYLTTIEGMALYTYGKDTSGVSNCSGACAANWPPYTVPAGAELPVAPGVTGAVATITRADGTTQVTYKGMPLYFWVRDTKAGEVTGNNVGGFLVAKP